MDQPQAGRGARPGQAVRRVLAAGALLSVLAGCARHAVRRHAGGAPANEGAASWQAVERPDTVHYALAMGEVSSGATVIERVSPVYPASRLAACPPVVELIAKLIVDARGAVTEVRPGNAAAAAPDRAPYLEATRAAALRWQFSPLQINRWSADANGESHVVDSRTEPFSLDYLFRFTCHAGQGGVTAGEARGSR